MLKLISALLVTCSAGLAVAAPQGVSVELRRRLNVIVPRGVLVSFIGTSGFSLKVPTIIPFYCTPFFTRCKEKFCTIGKFF